MAVCEWLTAQHFCIGGGATGVAGMESWQSMKPGADVGASLPRSRAGQNGWITTAAIASSANLGKQCNMD